MVYHALSLKQPWAALLVAGRKTIEVRRWHTRYTGLLLIHAARVPDDRPEAWRHVTDDLREATELRQGVVGAGMLTRCIRYNAPDPFAIDAPRHLNDPSWFESRGLYGLCFEELRKLPFREVPGYVRIFDLEFDDLELLPPPPPEKPPGVLARLSRLAHSLRKSTGS